MGRKSAAAWVAANGCSGPVISAAPWRGRHGRAVRRVDESRDLVVDGRLVDPEQIDVFEALDAIAVEAGVITDRGIEE